MGKQQVDDKIAKQKLAAEGLGCGKSYSEIANELSVLVGFVRNVQAKLKAGKPLEDAPRAGRPRTTTAREDRAHEG